MDAKVLLGKNNIDDVRWLCSLTEAELDLLMTLKNLVKMRANKIGHEALSEKFDLRMLRTMSFIFMEHLKGKLKDVPSASEFDCNLSKQDLSGSFERMSIEDLCPYICPDKKIITPWSSLYEPPSQLKRRKKVAVLNPNDSVELMEEDKVKSSSSIVVEEGSLAATGDEEMVKTPLSGLGEFGFGIGKLEEEGI